VPSQRLVVRRKNYYPVDCLLPRLGSRGSAWGSTVFFAEQINGYLTSRAPLQSILLDFYLNQQGRVDLKTGDMLVISFQATSNRKQAASTTLSLTASHPYADLLEVACWSDCPSVRTLWAKKTNPRLVNSFFTNYTPTWQRDLRPGTDSWRRQGGWWKSSACSWPGPRLTLDEGITILPGGVPWWQHDGTRHWYDQNGRKSFQLPARGSQRWLPRKGSGRGATKHRLGRH